jgi:hypothetical protein
MAQRAEATSLAFNASFNGMSIDHSTRNEIENLLEDGYVGAGWCFVVHLPLPSGRFYNKTPAYYPQNSVVLWDGCELRTKN